MLKKQFCDKKSKASVEGHYHHTRSRHTLALDLAIYSLEPQNKRPQHRVLPLEIIKVD